MVDKTWLTTCATAGEFLYGQYTVTVLKKMYESKKGCTVSVNDLIATMKVLEKSGTILMSYLPGKLDENDDELGFFVPVECEGTPLEPMMKKADKDGNPYASLHLDEKERIELVSDCPEDLDYYVPTEKEIAQLMDEGYIRTPAMTELENQINKVGGDPDFIKGVWALISTDKLDMMDGVNVIMNGIFPEAKSADENAAIPQERVSKLPTMDDLNTLMPYINKFMNNVNLRARKGWRPDDLFKKMHPHGLTSIPTLTPGSVRAAKSMKESEAALRAMGANVDYSTIDNYVTVGEYGERRVTKVGRNDPCPCGSGKKYKKCHGR